MGVTRKAVREARRAELGRATKFKHVIGSRYTPTALGLKALAMSNPTVRYWHRMVN